MDERDERMTAAPVLRLLRRFGPRDDAGASEAELLGRFVEGRDESAFRELVRRHGPLVLGVCRRILHDPHDAEDAFQATFLVLARKAPAIGEPDRLANWLFGVACRTARKARAVAARREAVLRSLPGPNPPAATDVADAELGRHLAVEVERLPVKYRLPVLLCYFQGKTYDEAAGEIGCPRGTLSIRLTRARELLRVRLTRRGLAPAVGLLAVPLLSPVPAALADQTVRSAVAFATGAPVEGAATELARGVLHAMRIRRLPATGLAVLVTGALMAGAALLGRPPAPPAPAPPVAYAPGPPREKPKPPTVPITVRGRAGYSLGFGKPVVGAKVYLVSTRIDPATLATATIATATTDNTGHYEFKDAPLPVPSGWGTFQVFAIAPRDKYDLGFTWCGAWHYHDQPRNVPVGTNDFHLFRGEPAGKAFDLNFSESASLAGRLLDDAGQPVANAQVRIVNGINYLDTRGQEQLTNNSAFWAVGEVPVELTKTQTAADGRFRLGGLPRGALFLMEIKHPDFAYRLVDAATSDRLAQTLNAAAKQSRDRDRPAVRTDLNLTMDRPRVVTARVVWADTGKPAAGVRIVAAQEVGESHFDDKISDAAGRAALKLPPGEYKLRADPPAGAEYVRTEQPLSVAVAPDAQSLKIRVPRGCVLIFRAVDSRTGQGVAGVNFLYERDRQRGAWSLPQDLATRADNPVTDATGELRAVVPPGRRKIQLNACPLGYTLDQGESPLHELTLPASQTVRLTVRLRKQ